MRDIFCGIDFGTSNSTIGISDFNKAWLLPLEEEHQTLPSALFFNFRENNILYGRSAISAYVEGEEGRLMRALKSVLGSSLMHEQTRIQSRSISFMDILGHYFQFLKNKLEEEVQSNVDEIVLGRPVRFVDDDDHADNSAQAILQSIATHQGFTHIAFQYEPIAAALDYEQRVREEELVIVADLGGGTSDFSIVRVSPQRSRKTDRQNDILANTGIHIGGTDLDRSLSIAHVMPELGLGSWTKDRKRTLPRRYFHDLATWHCINFLYTPKIMNELRQIKFEAERHDLIDRLIKIVEARQGHSLALAIERAKIELTSEARTAIPLPMFADMENIPITRDDFNRAIEEAVDGIAKIVGGLLQSAKINAQAINTIFMTGGSSSVPILRETILSLFPSAKIVDGDLLGSVGTGLALDARRKFA